MLLFFDYADPLCWVVEELLVRSGSDADALQRFPFGSGTLDVDWEERNRVSVQLLEDGEQGSRAALEPTREFGPVNSQKGFELAFHGAEAGCFERVHRAIFEAHFGAGRDIGRIDELVNVARQVGLDPSEAKAVLDVDRHAEAVQAWRDRAVRAGVETTPTLVRDGQQFTGAAAVFELQRWLAG